MKMNLFGSLCFLILAGAVCATVSGAQQSSPDTAKHHKTDTCALLAGPDVQAVQGDAVQETKPSTQTGSGLIMSQCLFRTATPSKSVSVAVASAAAISPRAFWRKQFHSGKPASDQKEKAEKNPAAADKEEKEDDSTRPRAIAGVGEEAYWVGSPMVGALYVLKGNTFLRISVGGVREESARIKKSVALARLALNRL